MLTEEARSESGSDNHNVSENLPFFTLLLFLSYYFLLIIYIWNMGMGSEPHHYQRIVWENHR